MIGQTNHGGVSEASEGRHMSMRQHMVTRSHDEDKSHRRIGSGFFKVFVQEQCWTEWGER